MSTYNERMQAIVRDYRDSGGRWPATTKDIAAWAIERKLWQAQTGSIIAQCADHLARAMREEYMTDPQGRRVRAKHVAVIDKDGEQLPLWADIRTAPRAHMELAFQQRRQQIVGDCRHLKADVDSYNQNANPGAPIQTIFDFTLDLEELEHAEGKAA
jgi:hypothetical protein